MPRGRFTYEYPRPMVTVDSVLFAVRDEQLDVLLIQRGREPWKGMWATPGGFLDMDEDLDTAAARELAEETSIRGVSLRQFHTFGRVDRDPRGRVITVAYLGVADPCALGPRAGDDAAAAAWHSVAYLPPLAADHDDIIAAALKSLRDWLAIEGAACDLVPATVGLENLQQALGRC